MTTITATRSLVLLRRFLAIDAVVTSVNGLAYVVAPTWIGAQLGASTSVLVPVGAFLIVFGLSVGALAASRNPVRGAGFVIEANAAWAVISVAVALFGVLETNVIGTVWTVMQAGTVAAFAVLQWITRPTE
jgi:hypothetical protein